MSKYSHFHVLVSRDFNQIKIQIQFSLLPYVLKMEHFIELFCQLLLPNWQKYRILFKVHNNTFQKSEQIFEENKIDQDKCGAEAWGYASAGKFMISFIS